jgi:hypothetical protein
MQLILILITDDVLQNSNDGQELDPHSGNLLFKLLIKEPNSDLLVCMDLTNLLLPTLYKW